MGRKARLKRERRWIRTNPGAASALDVRHRLASEGVQSVAGPSTAPKLSDALLEIARPVIVQLGPHATRQRLETLLSIAMLAWNADLLPHVNTLIDDALRPVAVDRRGDLRRALDLMIERRRELYPEDRRLAAQVAVRMGTQPGDFSVTASYTQLPGTS